MTDESTKPENENGFPDAFAAVVLVVLPVVAILYWLSGMPTSQVSVCPGWCVVEASLPRLGNDGTGVYSQTLPA